MTERKKRPASQILNIGEIVDLDGKGTWAMVEEYDESSDIYIVTDRMGTEYDYVHHKTNTLREQYGEKAWNNALAVQSEAREEMGEEND